MFEDKVIFPSGGKRIVSAELQDSKTEKKDTL